VRRYADQGSKTTPSEQINEDVDGLAFLMEKLDLKPPQK
jgi:hypothetical protein